jgi:hypothetical protein
VAFSQILGTNPTVRVAHSDGTTIAVFSEMALIIRTMRYALIPSALSDMMLERLFWALSSRLATKVRYEVTTTRFSAGPGPGLDQKR